MENRLKEKIRGAITAYAIGDALGLGSEFMTLQEVKKHYPNGLAFFNQIIRDAHRAMYDPGDWTEETEMFLNTAELLTRTRGQLDSRQAASELVKWYNKGHLDVSAHIRLMFNNPQYLTDPHGVAMERWRKLGGAPETNELLGSMILVGIISEQDPCDQAERLISIVQCGSRARGAAAILAYAAHKILWFDYVPTPEELIEIGQHYSDDLEPYIHLAEVGGEALFERLGERENPSEIRKAMAAALAAMWRADDIRSAIHAIVNAGGDANTNAALAGAMLGLRLGISRLPDEWLVNLCGRDRLRQVAFDFAEALPDHCNLPQVSAS